jgi:2-polyprenyl-3-methyl-5-hydroxy-6-metoxy-1,4-benzoquinol methylase
VRAVAEPPSDRERARTYFDALAPDYDRAFRGEKGSWLETLVNRFYRGPTFVRRMELLDTLLRREKLEGAWLLDLGCGSGQVSLLAASLGARVHGIDIAPRMLEIARAAATRAGLGERARFEEGDVSVAALPQADVVLLVGVLEYYRHFEPLVARAAAAASRTLIVAHTRRVWHRMLLRKALFALQRSSVYFHPLEKVVGAAQAAGLRLHERHDEPGFALLVFTRA